MTVIRMHVGKKGFRMEKMLISVETLPMFAALQKNGYV